MTDKNGKSRGFDRVPKRYLHWPVSSDSDVSRIPNMYILFCTSRSIVKLLVIEYEPTTFQFQLFVHYLLSSSSKWLHNNHSYYFRLDEAGIIVLVYVFFNHKLPSSQKRPLMLLQNKHIHYLSWPFRAGTKHLDSWIRDKMTPQWLLQIRTSVSSTGCGLSHQKLDYWI